MLNSANIFVTGGAGTLGRAIARRRQAEGWTGRLTVYSTDDHKHQFMRKLYPDVQYVQGDIRNPVTLYNAMVGHDVVIHAAAVKVIPTSEWCSIDTFDVNVNGSLNVAECAIRADVSNVLAISTDKACHSANAYGSTKYMMEKIWQEFSRVEKDTIFNLVRYGNVLESTGSVVEAWKNSLANNELIKITDPEMTRFWLSPQQAVDLVIQAIGFTSGSILIPKAKSLSIGAMARYIMRDGNHFPVEITPLRPGEKMHETLLTVEETKYADHHEDGGFLLFPTTSGFTDSNCEPYSSDIAEQLTEGELAELLQDNIPNG